MQDVEQLDGLVRAADAVFLLTDSRESRWLPTLLAATHNKLLLNAALGFDSWVAMRHGVLAAPPVEAAASTSAAAAQPPRLGCYFCNDVVAPANSLAGRSMDEQCTVVRPGLARVAGATAVEMLAALVQHPAGAAAPAGGAAPAGAVLGAVPHMIRGTLMGFEQTHMTGSANPVCSACSDSVVDAYRQHGAAFVLDVLQVCPSSSISQPTLDQCGFKVDDSFLTFTRPDDARAGAGRPIGGGVACMCPCYQRTDA